MKALIAAVVVTLLAGCSSMNMHGQGSGDNMGMRSGASGGDMGMHSGASGGDMGMRFGNSRDGYNSMQDVFHTWIGS